MRTTSNGSGAMCSGTATRLATLLAALACCSVSCGTSEPKLSTFSSWRISLGADLCGAPAMSADGLALVPRSSLGVALSERTGPNGETRRGVSSTSMAGTLHALDASGHGQWSRGFPAGVGDPVVTDSGDIIVGSGNWTYWLGSKGAGKLKFPFKGAPLLTYGNMAFVADATDLYGIDLAGQRSATLINSASIHNRRFGAAIAAGANGLIYAITVASSDPTAPSPDNHPHLNAFDLAGNVRLDVDIAEHGNGSLLLDKTGNILLVGEAPVLGRRTVAFDPTGKVLWQIPHFAVQIIDGERLIGRDDTDGLDTVAAYSRAGKRLWKRPKNRATTMAMGSDHRVYAITYQDSVAGTGDWMLDVISEDGSLYFQHSPVMNAFGGPPVFFASGTVAVAGAWANQYPPFQSLVSGFVARASGHAKLDWNGPAGDAHNSRRQAGGATQRIPQDADLFGWWWRADGAVTRALWFGPAAASGPNAAGQPVAYQVLESVGGKPMAAVQEGGAGVSGAALHLSPTWSKSASMPPAVDRALATGTAWVLHLADPISGAKVTWQRALSQPSPTSPYDGAGQATWARVDGGVGDEALVAMALTGDGRAFVGGAYMSASGSQFGGKPIDQPACPSAADCLNVGSVYGVIGNSGKWEWIKYEVTAKGSPPVPRRVALDKQGQAVVLALVDPSWGGGAGGINQHTAMVVGEVSRWSLDGKRLATFPLGTTGVAHVYIWDLALMPDGGWALTGYVDGSGEVAPGVSLTSGKGTGRDLWVARFSPDGSNLWALTLDRPGSDHPYGFASDSSGNLLIVSAGEGGPGGQNPPNGLNSAVMRLDKLDPNGKTLWSKDFGGGLNHSNSAAQLAVAANGDIALGGSWMGAVNFGLGLNQTKEADIYKLDSDGFVVRMDGNGKALWQRIYTGTGPQYIETVAFDPNGMLIAAGSMDGPIQFGTPPFRTSARFVEAYDACGDPAWNWSPFACDGCAANYANIRPYVVAAETGGTVWMGGTLDGAFQSGAISKQGYGTDASGLYPNDFLLVKLTGLTPAGVAAFAAAECTLASAQGQALVVTLSGTGQGRVTSSPPGIDCPGACKATFKGTDPVVLTATASPGASFSGWSGACSGSGTCSVALAGPQAVTAQFDHPALLGTAVVGHIQGHEQVRAGEVDADGGVWMLGVLGQAGPNDYGGGAQVTAGGEGLALTRFELAGGGLVPAAASACRSANGLSGYGLGVDGDAIATILVQIPGDAATCNGQLLTSTGAGQLGLLRIGKDGVALDLTRLPAPVNSYSSVVSGASGVRVVTGQGIGTSVDLGGGVAIPTGGWVLVVDAQSQPLWARELAPSAIPTRAAVDANGRVLVAGFAPGSGSARLWSASGDPLWTADLGAHIIPAGVALSADGAWVAGQTYDGTPTTIAGKVVNGSFAARVSNAGVITGVTLLPAVWLDPPPIAASTLALAADGSVAVLSRLVPDAPMVLPPGITDPTVSAVVWVLKADGTVDWIRGLSADPSQSTFSGLQVPAIGRTADGRLGVVGAGQGGIRVNQTWVPGLGGKANGGAWDAFAVLWGP